MTLHCTVVWKSLGTPCTLSVNPIILESLLKYHCVCMLHDIFKLKLTEKENLKWSGVPQLFHDLWIFSIRSQWKYLHDVCCGSTFMEGSTVRSLLCCNHNMRHLQDRPSLQRYWSVSKEETTVQGWPVVSLSTAIQILCCPCAQAMSRETWKETSSHSMESCTLSVWPCCSNFLAKKQQRGHVESIIQQEISITTPLAYVLCLLWDSPREYISSCCRRRTFCRLS